jgi:single-strand DNA-binding protein
MARSLNKVQLIGNLTRDPELRYTPSGTAVCSFSIATNRSWTNDAGEKKDEVEFHRIVAWNKLAELCSQFLVKGRKVFVEGRLQTRSWAAQDGTQKQTTEIIISDMILLDSKRNGDQEAAAEEEVAEEASAKTAKAAAKKAEKEEVTKAPKEDEIAPDDIPF